MGKDGIECPAFCPSTCGPEEMSCWGGEDMNMCQMPDFCVPSKGNVPLYTLYILRKSECLTIGRKTTLELLKSDRFFHISNFHVLFSLQKRLKKSTGKF